MGPRAELDTIFKLNWHNQVFFCHYTHKQILLSALDPFFMVNSE